MVDIILHLLIIAAIYAILSISLNIMTGTTGLFNLGLAAFYGIGAYSSALLAKAGVPFPLALLGGILIPSAIAFVIGLPTLQLVGDYLAVVTMGLGEITRSVFKNWVSLTGGYMGLRKIPKASLFGFDLDGRMEYLIFSLVILVVVYFFVERLLKAPFGRVLRAIREDEMAAQALGKNVFRFKMWALLIGTGIAGLAGALFAHYINVISPADFVMWLTFFIFLVIMFGGLGNNLGAIVATVIFVLGREALRFIGLPPSVSAPLQQLIFGLLLIFATIYFPKGLIQEKRQLVKPDPEQERTKSHA
ncbi:MAG: branched-chain amino acid ABC transporter permease [Thermodesulfobacteriota bacterium]